MKPSIGRIITVHVAQPWNGVQEHPAIITRVWGDNDPAEAKGSFVCVNTQVFLDANPAQVVTSVPLYETREEAEAGGAPCYAYWPEKV